MIISNIFPETKDINVGANKGLSMLKVTFLLSLLVSFDVVFARYRKDGRRERCREDDRRDNKKSRGFDFDLSFCNSDSRYYRDNSSCSSYSACSSFGSDSSSSRHSRTSRASRNARCAPICGPIIPVTSTPSANVDQCTIRYENLLRSLDNALLAAINAFQMEYKGQLNAFLSAIAVLVAEFNPEFVGSDYIGFIAELRAIPGVRVSSKLAEQLLKIQLEAVIEISAEIKAILNAMITDLLCRIETLCLPELIDLVTSGVFANQITNILSSVTSGVPRIVNAVLSKQFQVICKLRLSSQAQAFAKNFLQTNAFALAAFIDSEYAMLQGQIDSLLASLLSSLSSFLFNQVLNFQNLAIVEINKLVTAIFGTSTSIPPAIPPVVATSALGRASALALTASATTNLLTNPNFVLSGINNATQRPILTPSTGEASVEDDQTATPEEEPAV